MYGPNIKAFWAAVREHSAALTDEFYYLMSLTDPTRGLVGDVVVHVTREAAAKALVQKTHRLATPEEVAAWEAAERKKRAGYEESEQRRLMQTVPLYLQPQHTNQSAKGGKG